MARKILEGAQDAGVSVKMYDVAATNRTEVIKDMLDANGFIIGSSTHDNDMLPSVAAFLEFLKGLRPKGRIAGVFGSYGWAGGAVGGIEKSLKEAQIGSVINSLSVKYVPDENELKQCYEYGKEFAAKVK